MSDLKSTLWLADDGSAVVRRLQDVEPHLEHAKALRAIGAVGSSELRHAAHIPAGVVEMYKQRHGISHHEMFANPEHFRRLLNDPDLAGFRIWEGQTRSGDDH